MPCAPAPIPAPNPPLYTRPCPLSRLDQDIGAAKCQYTGCRALHTLHRIIRTLSAEYYLADGVRSVTHYLVSTAETALYS